MRFTGVGAADWEGVSARILFSLESRGVTLVTFLPPLLNLVIPVVGVIPQPVERYADLGIFIIGRALKETRQNRSPLQLTWIARLGWPGPGVEGLVLGRRGRGHCGNIVDPCVDLLLDFRRLARKPSRSILGPYRVSSEFSPQDSAQLDPRDWDQDELILPPLDRWIFFE
eukprot:474229-Amorphochlora_amoeboformis.AAC.2